MGTPARQVLRGLLGMRVRQAMPVRLLLDFAKLSAEDPQVTVERPETADLLALREKEAHTQTLNGTRRVFLTVATFRTFLTATVEEPVEVVGVELVKP